MKLFVNVLMFVAISYNFFQLFIFMKKRRGKVLIPASAEETTAIRKYPQTKDVHKETNVIPYMLVLITILVLYILGFIFSKPDEWAFNLMLLLLLINSNNLLNGFAIIEEGVLSEGRFIPWKKAKEFSFVSIDVNHRLYGYSKEANNGYELKIKGKFFGTGCIVTTDEMKEKLTAILSEHIECDSRKVNV